MDSFATRHVFPSWSIEMPPSMEETYVHEGQGYWHAYSADRSISLTSMSLTDGEEHVPAVEIVAKLPLDFGEPFAELPPGLHGWAVTNLADPDARASRLLSGIVAVDGHVLIATITCDDEAWTRRVWLSIRNHPVDEVATAVRRAIDRLRDPSRPLPATADHEQQFGRG